MTIEHVDAPLGEIHPPHNWEYADATARAAASITDAALLKRLALQLDDNSFWLLTGVSPATWVAVGGGGSGTPGPAGADGKTVRNGTTIPSSGLGVDGDFYIRTGAWTIYGPKAGGAWGSATSLVGPAGAAGADGVAGNTVLYGTGAPSNGTGVDGNFYIATNTNFIYGPKASGTWPAGTSLVGPKGDQGDAGAGAALAIKDEGTTLTASATSIDFIGAGVTAAGSGSIAVTIPAATKASVGLGNADNTSDADKPVSTAQAAAISAKEPTFAAGTNSQWLRGDKTFQSLTKGDAGLGNVDNTSDANKPVSTAQAAAIAAKEPSFAAGTTSQWLRGDKTFQTLTKSDVSLGNVDNTSDANKPVSTAQAAADTTALNAAKAYADSLVVGLWDDRGNYNASVNTFPASGGSGSAGAVLKGDIWTITVAGTLGGTAVSVGQTVRATVDTPGQTAGNWAISVAGLANIDDVISDGVTGRAPSQNAVFDALALKEDAIAAGTTAQYLRGNKTWSDFATDVRAVVLTGISFATGTAVVAGDTVLAAIGKLQKQITDLIATKDATGGIVGMTLFKINFKNAANTFTSFFTNANTAARTYTFPDYDSTVATTGGTETLTGKTLTTPTLTNPTITNFTESGAAPAAGAAYTVDLNNGTDFEVTTNAAFTATLPSPAAGKSFTLTVNYGGAHTLAFAGGTIRWTGGGTAPTATSTNGKADIYVFKSNRAGTAWFGSDGGRNA